MFRCLALSPERFAPLFALSDVALRAHRARRVAVTAQPGFPCRISLEDAPMGEEVLLVHYEHQDADSPFRASHAVYVRPNARPAALAVDELPAVFRGRTMSLRGFDAEGMLRGATLTTGEAAAPAIEALLADPDVAYLHAHFAAYGCYAARIERA